MQDNRYKYLFYSFNIGIGLFCGMIFPVIFVTLDLKELGQKVSYQSVKWVIGSQDIYTFSIIAFPIVFSLLGLFISMVLISKKELIKTGEQLLIKQRKTMMNSKLASIGEMAAGMAHEINNPLTILALSIKKLKMVFDKNKDLIDNELFNEQIIPVTEKMANANDRITSIIQTMKKLSRDTKDDDYKEEYLVDIISDSIGFCIEKYKYAGIEIRENYENFKVKCRRTEVCQVLVNLLNNSLQALKELDKEDKFVIIKSDTDDKFIYLKINDSGKGIPKNILVNIFDPFYTTKNVDEGTGLGLSISKKIMNNHGGDLFYNEQSENTEFVLSFPKV